MKMFVYGHGFLIVDGTNLHSISAKKRTSFLHPNLSNCETAFKRQIRSVQCPPCIYFSIVSNSRRPPVHIMLIMWQSVVCSCIFIANTIRSSVRRPERKKIRLAYNRQELWPSPQPKPFHSLLFFCFFVFVSFRLLLVVRLLARNFRTASTG